MTKSLMQVIMNEYKRCLHDHSGTKHESIVSMLCMQVSLAM